MFGITNSANKKAENGAGGQTVTAIKNIDGELSVGDKVWLNKHNLDDTTTVQTIADYQRNMYGGFFFKGSDAYRINYVDGKFSKWKYDSGQKSWTGYDVYTADKSNDFNGIRIIEDKAIAYTTYSNTSATAIRNVILEETYSVPMYGYYLGDELIYNPGNKTLCAVNTTTGETGEVYYTFNHANVWSAFKEDNILFLAGTSGWWWYDITDLTAPVLLKQNTNVNLYVHIVTGVKPGNYIFTVTNDTNGGYYGVGNLVAYKITDNYEIVSPTDLPASLKGIIGTTASLYYLNNILTIGTADNVYAYQFANGVFTDLGITQDLSSYAAYKYSGYPFIFYISKDLTTAALCYRRQSNSYVYCQNVLMKLVTSSEEWYADGFNEANAYSLNGFVKSVDGNAVEVMTCLPEEVNLTLDFNVEPDVVEFKGEVK